VVPSRHGALSFGSTCPAMLRGMGAGLGAIVFLGGAFGFIFAIEKLKNSAAGVPLLLDFILYDLKRVQDGHETNYITATLGVYLSLYNVFQSLLILLGIGGGDD
jgi:modulator of FtsH protease